MRRYIHDYFLDNYKLYYSLIYNIVGSKEDTLDILQNVSVRILETDHLAKSKKAVKVWLIRVCKNQSINYIKKRQDAIDIDEALLYVGKEEETFDLIDINEVIEACLLTIPLDVRDALELIYFKDVPIVDAVKMASIQRSRLYRWKKTFEKDIKRMLDME